MKKKKKIILFIYNLDKNKITDLLIAQKVWTLNTECDIFCLKRLISLFLKIFKLLLCFVFKFNSILLEVCTMRNFQFIKLEILQSFKVWKGGKKITKWWWCFICFVFLHEVLYLKYPQVLEKLVCKTGIFSIAHFFYEA